MELRKKNDHKVKTGNLCIWLTSRISPFERLFTIFFLLNKVLFCIPKQILSPAPSPQFVHLENFP